MAVKTYWICDSCGAKKVKDANETLVQGWFSVILDIGMLLTKRPFKSKGTRNCGYVCSEKCLEKVIDWLKESAIENMSKGGE